MKVSIIPIVFVALIPSICNKKRINIHLFHKIEKLYHINPVETFELVLIGFALREWKI
jgi:hypothetical protein